MNRRAALALATSAGFGALIMIWFASHALASRRAAKNSAYTEAAARQRADSMTGGAARAVVASPELLCVRGVDAIVTTLDRSLREKLIDKSGRLDVRQLEHLSSRAVAASRYAEQAVAGPAPPQRLGRMRTERGWKPLKPRQLPCGDGKAYAAIRTRSSATSP